MRRRPSWLAVRCLIFVMVAILCGGCRQGMRPHWVAFGRVPLGLETPGTSIDEFRLGGGFEPAPTELRVKTPKSTVMLTSLRQLQDLVKIASSIQALHFVRLRTSRCYCYDWSGGAIQEVISTDQIKKPAFADTGCPNSMGGAASPLSQSGLYAVLSPAAYRKGKFHAPTVRAISGGYEITRWVCSFKGLEVGRVQEWQETVGPNGSYHLKVLKSETPPKLPGTQWEILGLE